LEVIGSDPRSIIKQLIIDVIIIEKGFIEWYYYRQGIFSNFLLKLIKINSDVTFLQFSHFWQEHTVFAIESFSSRADLLLGV